MSPALRSSRPAAESFPLPQCTQYQHIDKAETQETNLVYPHRPKGGTTLTIDSNPGSRMLNTATVENMSTTIEIYQAFLMAMPDTPLVLIELAKLQAELNLWRSTPTLTLHPTLSPLLTTMQQCPKTFSNSWNPSGSSIRRTRIHGYETLSLPPVPCPGRTTSSSEKWTNPTQSTAQCSITTHRYHKIVT